MKNETRKQRADRLAKAAAERMKTTTRKEQTRKTLFRHLREVLR